MTLRSRPIKERFWEKVDRRGDDECWEWLAGTNGRGYGLFHVSGSRGTQVRTTAHRVSYELFVGQIPDGFHIDHLCRNPICVNPAHLEAVTPRENCLRGISPAAENSRLTHCRFGHEFVVTNYPSKGRRRQCPICDAERNHRWHVENRSGGRRRVRVQERDAA